MQTKRYRRRRYLVDWRLQLAITAQLLGVLAGVGLLYTVGLFVLPGRDALSELEPEQLRTVLLRANAIYFALGAAILGVLAILLTHRVAGPALVLRRALEGLRKGEWDQRLFLRRRDYLKPLAAELDALRNALKSAQEQRLELLAELSQRLEDGDVDGARGIVARLRSGEKVAEQAERPVHATTAI